MNYTEFSNRYDEIYKSNLQNSTWPWSDLVSKVMYVRRQLPDRMKVLELGCGQGANISFFKGLGADYHSVEASSHTVNQLRKLYPDYAQNIRYGNFIEADYGEVKFDLVVDRASLTCNPSSEIRRCLQNLRKNWAPGGFFVGIDWYSVRHDEYNKGSSPDEDPFFKKFDLETAFFHPPQMHFSDEEHLRSLFQDFEMLHLEEKTTVHVHTFKNLPKVISSWNFVAQMKP